MAPILYQIKMKLTILDYSHGKLHIYDVNSQTEVMNYVDKHKADGWMLSQENEFEIIHHE